jgi:hypothetical protein
MNISKACYSLTKLFVLKEMAAIVEVERNETIADMVAVVEDQCLVKLELLFQIVRQEALVALPDKMITITTSRQRQLGSFF